MRRKNPFYSLSGIFLTAVFISVLVWSLWVKGGLAFNPGPLTALNRSGAALQGYRSHAEMEEKCSACHQPLASNQAPLCLQCHTAVAEEISSGEELHGMISTADSGIPVDRCYACHSDHRGRDFSPAQAALDDFDHSLTGFSLIRHQVSYDASPIACEACHDTLASHARIKTGNNESINQSCQECHAGHDQAFMQAHTAEFGMACTGCHDGVDLMVDFDHQQTNFPLDGKHADIQCTQCHVDAANTVHFEGISGRCSDCHREPAMHAGMFSVNCQECHSTQAWVPASLEGASFDHAVQTRFSLVLHQQDYHSSPLECSTCHTSDLTSLDTGTCIDCHADHDEPFMQDHLTQFGESCMDCHDGVDRLSNFDHSRFFPLEGRHAQIECQACHGAPPEAVRYVGTPTACAGCHVEPEIHAGVFGLECQDCHSPDAWSPALLRVHSFPLDHGGQGVVECQVCHPATYVEYTCYGCHEHDPQETASKHQEEGISQEELPNCTRCHPTGLEDEAEEGGDG